MNRQNEQTHGHGEQAGDCWRGGGGWADRRKDEGGGLQLQSRNVANSTGYSQ